MRRHLFRIGERSRWAAFEDDEPDGVSLRFTQKIERSPSSPGWVFSGLGKLYKRRTRTRTHLQHGPDHRVPPTGPGPAAQPSPLQSASLGEDKPKPFSYTGGRQRGRLRRPDGFASLLKQSKKQFQMNPKEWIGDDSSYIQSQWMFWATLFGFALQEAFTASFAGSLDTHFGAPRSTEQRSCRRPPFVLSCDSPPPQKQVGPTPKHGKSWATLPPTKTAADSSNSHVTSTDPATKTARCHIIAPGLWPSSAPRSCRTRRPNPPSPADLLRIVSASATRAGSLAVLQRFGSSELHHEGTSC